MVKALQSEKGLEITREVCGNLRPSTCSLGSRVPRRILSPSRKLHTNLMWLGEQDSKPPKLSPTHWHHLGKREERFLIESLTLKIRRETISFEWDILNALSSASARMGTSVKNKISYKNSRNVFFPSHVSINSRGKYHPVYTYILRAQLRARERGDPQQMFIEWRL